MLFRSTPSNMFNKDFGKDTLDFLSKGIPKDRKLEVTKTGFPNSNFKLVFTGRTASDDSAVGTLATTFTSASLEAKGELNSAGDHTALLTYSNAFTRGLKLQGNLELGNKQRWSVASDYVFNNGTVSGKFIFPANTTNTIFEGGAVFSKPEQKYSVGLFGALAIHEGFNINPDKVVANLQVKGDNYTASVAVSSTASQNLTGEFRFFQKLDNRTFASEFTYNHSSNTAGASAGIAFPALAGDLKTTVSTSGSVGVGYKRSFVNSSITVGSNYSYVKRTTNFGLNVDLTL